MSFAWRMENEMAPTNKRTEARTHLLDAKSVAFLLAPCILFAYMACYAVIFGTQYADMPQAKEVLERQRKDEDLRKIIAANIAAGDPIPQRETMLEELDVRDERVKAWERVVVACAWSMRRIGVGVLLGVVAQFYVILRLRVHYKKLASSATAPS
jgi:hypothetical protein